MSSIRFAFFLFISFLSFLSHAATPDEKKLKQQALLTQLDQHPRWLKLLHYKVDGNNQESLVDDDRFFLASNGKTSSKSELLANLAMALQNTNDGAQYRCRFPARIKFLEKNLGIRLKLASDSCPDFDAWQQEHIADEAWLVFPSAYLNSPSSMFGHTLLRLDKRNEKGSVLTSSAVNYAATVDEQENGFIYAFKGLFGGYPGYFSMTPYYKKVKEYSRIENRDIWEYKLNLTAEELDWLIRHLWELDKIKFDYYFTTQNCSYQLLALLDVVRPTGNLTAPFELVAIPVDTVRALKDSNWIERAVFRASKATEFYEAVTELDQTKQQHIASIKQLDTKTFLANIDHYKTAEKIDIINAAYKLVRLEKSAKQSKKKALSLLRYRSRLGKAQKSLTLPSAKIRPENGHKGSRFSFGLTGNNEEESGVFLDYKITYHGLDDPIDGYAKGAHINFLHAQAFALEDDLLLERFDVLDIRSLAASDQFIDRLAWQVNTGWDRKLFQQGERKLVKQLNAQTGKVYNIGSFNWYGLLGAHIEHAEQYQNHYQVGPNLHTGFFYQGDTYSTELAIHRDYYPDEESTRDHFIWSNTWRYQKDIAIGVDVKSEYYQKDSRTDKRESSQKGNAYTTITLKSAFFF